MCALDPDEKPEKHPSTLTVKSPLPDVPGTNGIAERSFELQGKRRAL